MDFIYMLLIRCDIVSSLSPLSACISSSNWRYPPSITRHAIAWWNFIASNNSRVWARTLVWTFYKGAYQPSPSYNFEPHKHLSWSLRTLAIFSKHWYLVLKKFCALTQPTKFATLKTKRNLERVSSRSGIVTVTVPQAIAIWDLPKARIVMFL